MKIRKMTAHFGALDGKTLELSDGLNILYAPNESGKSTWCAFIRAMLYGIDTSQRARAGSKPDKVKYRPWNGTPMSGTMEVAAGGGFVTLSRWTERANQPMQAFSAVITGTEQPVPGLRSDSVGETLTGVPREVFERSAFIRQAGLELSNAPELDRRIGAIVSSGDEEISYMETDKTLKSWLRHRRSGRRGAIPELEEEMSAVRERLDALQSDAREAAEVEEELSRLEPELKTAEQDMQRARSEQRRKALAAFTEARAAADEARDAAKQARDALKQANDAVEGTPYHNMGPEEAARRAQEDIRTANELERRADKLPQVKLAFIPLALAVLAFLLAVVLPPWRIGCAAAGCVLMLLFAAMLFGLQRLKREKADMRSERKRILDAYGVSEPHEIEGLLEEYRTLWQRKEQAQHRCDEADMALDKALWEQKRAEARALGELDVISGDSEAARAGRRVEAIKSRIAELRERRASAEGKARATGDAMALRSGLIEQQARLERLKKQEMALNLAIDTMAEADAELQQRFSPRLAKTAAALFSRLTEGRYDEVTLARDLTAKTRLSGDAVGWEADYLSSGAKDQLYLALRLAICELALPEGDMCPVILDDALVNFDSERMARALMLIRELSETRQVLLFTCHEREYDYFAADRAVHRLAL